MSPAHTRDGAGGGPSGSRAERRGSGGRAGAGAASGSAVDPPADEGPPEVDLEAQRAALAAERQARLVDVREEHEAKLHELFFMETWVSLVEYDPQMAKEESSEVYDKFKAPHDLVANVAGPSRRTRRGHTERLKTLALSSPGAGPSISAPPQGKRKGKMEPPRASVSSAPRGNDKGKGKERAWDDEPLLPSSDAYSEEELISTRRSRRDAKLARARAATDHHTALEDVRPESASAGAFSKGDRKRPTAEVESAPTRESLESPSPRKRRKTGPLPPLNGRSLSSGATPSTPSTALDVTDRPRRSHHKSISSNKDPQDPKDTPPTEPPPAAPLTRQFNIRRVKLLVRRPHWPMTNPNQRPPVDKFGLSLPKFLSSFVVVDDEELEPSAAEERARHDGLIWARYDALRRQGRLVVGTAALDSNFMNTVVKAPATSQEHNDVWGHIVKTVIERAKPRYSGGRQLVQVGGRQIALAWAKGVAQYWEGHASRLERARTQEERRLRMLAKNTIKMVVQEWRKAVFHIREQQRLQEEAEELRRGHAHLDAILDQSGQILENQQVDLARGDASQSLSRASSISLIHQYDSDNESHGDGNEESDDEENDEEVSSMLVDDSDGSADEDDEEDATKALLGSDPVLDATASSTPAGLSMDDDESQDTFVTEETKRTGNDKIIDESLADENSHAAPTPDFPRAPVVHEPTFDELTAGDEPPLPRTPVSVIDVDALDTPPFPAHTPDENTLTYSPYGSPMLLDTGSDYTPEEAHTNDIYAQARLRTELVDEAAEPPTPTVPSAETAVIGDLGLFPSTDTLPALSSKATPSEAPSLEAAHSETPSMQTHSTGAPIVQALPAEALTKSNVPTEDTTVEAPPIAVPPVESQPNEAEGVTMVPDTDNNLDKAAVPHDGDTIDDHEEDVDDADEDLPLPDYLKPYAVAPVEWDPETKVKPPLLLRGVLRPYQQSGLEWLASLHVNNLNGILADEMGLGKTIQTISLLAHLACDRGIWGPHLIIVPTSVLLNWEMEFKKFLPGFKILSYHGSTKRRKELRQGWNDKHHFNRKAWYYMILDEAHMIKNFRSQRWNILLMFRSFRRLLLTGTPLQNNLTELWALLQFLMSGSNFANLKEFGEWFSNPLEKAIEMGNVLDEETMQRVSKLHTVLRPYLLRRLKRDVEKELPSKYEHLVMCSLSKRQRFLYDEFMARAHTREALESGVYQKIANILMQLRKVCNHPDLFEVRPIVTSFTMSRSAIADFEIKELLVRRQLLTADEDTPDLDILGLRFMNLVGMSSVVAGEVQRLEATHRLPCIGEIPGEPPPKDTRTIAGFRTYTAYQRRAAEIARWANIARLNRSRCAASPLLGQETIKFVRQFYQPLLPASARDTRADYLNIPERASRCIKSYVERAEDMAEVIDRFAFVTPAVVALDLPRFALGLKSEPPTAPGFDDLLHRASVKLQIAFPDPALIQYDCGKLQELATLLREKKAGGHRVLIFTQMTRVLDILEIFLNLHGWLYLRLDGATKIEDRQYVTERFNADARVFCFIASSRSGGVGINLTGADTVVFYDSDFNPQMDRQCEDRAHRIGQIRDVHIYRFVSRHTVEEALLRTADQKRALDDVVIQQGAFDWRTVLGSRGADGLVRALGEFEDSEDARAAAVAAQEEVAMVGQDAADFEAGPREEAVSEEVAGELADNGEAGDIAEGGDNGEEGYEGEDGEGGTVVEYMLARVRADWDYFGEWRI